MYYSLGTRQATPRMAPESWLQILRKVCVVWGVILVGQVLLSEGRSWAVKIASRDDAESTAEELAASLGLTHRGRVEPFPDIFLLEEESFPKTASARDADCSFGTHRLERSLSDHPAVLWAWPQDPLRRVKRGRDTEWSEFKDPRFSEQWHLVNSKEPGNDINVTEVWQEGVTGRGVVIAVVDDGLEWRNSDISQNYNAVGSYDFNSDDGDPTPHLEGAVDNAHGTKCAGLTAAVSNDVCGVGVAYEAGISGIRMLDGTVTDIIEAKSFIYHAHVNWIYSCSWGPEDDGRTVEGPGHVGMEALELAINKGRYGHGNIFVFASGNGGRKQDNCNFDGYANSMYTLTIGAVEERNKMPWYAEQCPSMLAVTYSNGIGDRSIITTDVSKHHGCTTQFTGTSAAAPIAAGIMALVLQVRNCLSWRDVQSLTVYTSVKVDQDGAQWVSNAAGFSHSEQHGFGLLDAFRLTRAAGLWPLLPKMQEWVRESDIHHRIPVDGQELRLQADVSSQSELASLEYVAVTVSITHQFRGALSLTLTSPQGTFTNLATTRKYDTSSKGLDQWTFTAVRFWGEPPNGIWTLVIKDDPSIGSSTPRKKGGTLKLWRLTLYGSNITQADIEHRMTLVEEAVAMDHALWSERALVCPPLPSNPKELHLDDIEEYDSLPMWKKILIFVASVVFVGCLLNLLAFWGSDLAKKFFPKSCRNFRDSSQHSNLTVKFVKGASNEEENEALLLPDEAGPEGSSGDRRENDRVMFVPVELTDGDGLSEEEVVVFDASATGTRHLECDIPRLPPNQEMAKLDHVTVTHKSGDVTGSSDESDTELNTCSEGTPLMNGTTCDQIQSTMS